MEQVWEKFLESCEKEGFKVSDVNATLWDEADCEHKPIHRTDAYIAKIGDSIAILENPDGHLYCLFIIGESIHDLQDIWNEITDDEDEDEDDEDDEDEDDEDEDDENEDDEGEH